MDTWTIIQRIAASETAAAWAQAIGATVAIGLTWWLARGEARDRRRQEVEQMKVALFLITDAHEHLARACKGFENETAVAAIGTKLLRNEALAQTRQSMIRAEERVGMPVTALSTLISCSADITRALAIASGMSGRTAVTAVPAFNGAVGTLRNRALDLAEIIHHRGGYREKGDPRIVSRWLRNSPSTEFRRRLLMPYWRIAQWSLMHDTSLARAVRRVAYPSRKRM